jgi:hypothetical protein
MKTGVFAFDGYCSAVRYYVALKTWSCLLKTQAGQATDILLLMGRAVGRYLIKGWCLVDALRRAVDVQAFQFMLTRDAQAARPSCKTKLGLPAR